MKGWLKNAAVVILLSTGAQNVDAGTINLTSPTWRTAGGPAGSCSLSYPTLQPLSRPRTLLVDNNLPVGSVLYSWDYNDFAPNFVLMCNTTTTLTTSAPSDSSGFPEVREAAHLYFTPYFSSIGGSNHNHWLTNNPGIGIRFYIKPTIINSQDSGYPLPTLIGGNGTTTIVPRGNIIGLVGREYEFMYGSYNYLIVYFTTKMLTSPPNYQHYMGSDINYVSYSIRAELIKIGNIQPSNELFINSNSKIYQKFAGTSTYLDVQEMFGGGGISIASPSCRLRGTTDYQVDLGEWHEVTGNNTDSLPARGVIKPIDINLECSGKVDNVNFSFQDTGTNPLESKNISVYDSSGRQSIEGLEIEMSYRGIRHDVSSTADPASSYPVNIGTMGTVKTNAEDFSFNSQGSAQFGARFVQRGAIKRNGVRYTGPVSGQVNMFVTYN